MNLVLALLLPDIVLVRFQRQQEFGDLQIIPKIIIIIIRPSNQETSNVTTVTIDTSIMILLVSRDCIFGPC